MSRLALGCSLLFLSLRMASHVHAQTPVDIRDLKLRDWEPRLMLVSRTTSVLKANDPEPGCLPAVLPLPRDR